MYGARRFLERQYLAFVDKTVDSHPSRALLGGKPAPEERIRAFLRVRFPASSPYNAPRTSDDQNWALLYYLLRCGIADKVKAILQGSLQATIDCFIGNTSPSSKLSEELAVEYKKLNDPFKAAVYKILGKCDLQKKTFDSEVMQATEDYLWMQLGLIRRDDSSDALAALQENIRGFEKSFSGPNTNPFKFFQMLLLTAQFETVRLFLSFFLSLLLPYSGSFPCHSS